MQQMLEKPSWKEADTLCVFALQYVMARGKRGNDFGTAAVAVSEF